MSLPEENASDQQPPTKNPIVPPTWKELQEMETARSVAKSYLMLLNDIVEPPDFPDESDSGMGKFCEEARMGMSFMIGDILKALTHHDTLLAYSYESIKQNKRGEVNP